MQLNDASLFRQQAYVDGEWIDADDGAVIEVDNPATGNSGTLLDFPTVDTPAGRSDSWLPQSHGSRYGSPA